MLIDDALALVRRQAEAWTARDPERVAAAFSEAALFEAPGPTVVHGRSAIAALVAEFAATVSAVEIEVTNVVCGPHGLALEWIWRERRLGETGFHEAHDAIVADVDEAGRIVRWREYFDPAQMVPEHPAT